MQKIYMILRETVGNGLRRHIMKEKIIQKVDFIEDVVIGMEEQHHLHIGPKNFQLQLLMKVWDLDQFFI